MLNLLLSMNLFFRNLLPLSCALASYPSIPKIHMLQLIQTHTKYPTSTNLLNPVTTKT